MFFRALAVDVVTSQASHGRPLEDSDIASVEKDMLIDRRQCPDRRTGEIDAEIPKQVVAGDERVGVR